jgi:hypothetical protein
VAAAGLGAAPPAAAGQAWTGRRPSWPRRGRAGTRARTAQTRQVGPAGPEARRERRVRVAAVAVAGGGRSRRSLAIQTADQASQLGRARTSAAVTFGKVADPFVPVLNLKSGSCGFSPTRSLCCVS